MSKRTNSRKLAMRMLYQYSIRETMSIEAIFNDMDTQNYAKETLDLAIELANKTVAGLEELDRLIESFSIDWDMDRIHLIDKALLRLGIAEIKFFDTPYQVVMNEVIELSKEYSTDDSSKFINGLLGNYVETHCKD